MPWKECAKVTEKLKFIGRLLNEEKMTDLCREYGISRATGYDIFNRYKEEGLKALHEKSRRPQRLGNQTPVKVENAILQMKKKYPTWGAPKILDKLQKTNVSLKLPARSTVHAILDRHGLVVKKQSRRKFISEGTGLTEATSANALWCTDFKGQFRMGNRGYCYPLTITDQHSRYLLACEGLESTQEKGVITHFKRIFVERGLPDMIRSDNGVPFASAGLFGLSRLSVMWLNLGIGIERIVPGHPEQNGRHERMHKTLKQEVTKPPGKNLLQQQEMFDHFIKVFNNERPHEALSMQSPSEVYRASKRNYSEANEEYDYTNHEILKRISSCGRIQMTGNHKVYISQTLGGQIVGINKIEDGIWSVTFRDYLLGYFSGESTQFNPGQNPFLKNNHPNV